MLNTVEQAIEEVAISVTDEGESGLSAIACAIVAAALSIRELANAVTELTHVVRLK